MKNFEEIEDKFGCTGADSDFWLLWYRFWFWLSVWFSLWLWQ